MIRLGVVTNIRRQQNSKLPGVILHRIDPSNAAVTLAISNN